MAVEEVIKAIQPVLAVLPNMEQLKSEWEECNILLLAKMKDGPLVVYTAHNFW